MFSTSGRPAVDSGFKAPGTAALGCSGGPLRRGLVFSRRAWYPVGTREGRGTQCRKSRFCLRQGSRGNFSPWPLEAAEEGERLEGAGLLRPDRPGGGPGRAGAVRLPAGAVQADRVLLCRRLPPDVLFQDCDLSQCRFTKASLTRCAFDGCKALGADLSGASLRDVSFSNCRLDLANCNAAALRDVAFRDCSMEGRRPVRLPGQGPDPGPVRPYPGQLLPRPPWPGWT